jgi:hypothetical protein
MHVRQLACLALAATALVVHATPARAQHSSGTAPARAVRPPREATQYDFLVGQWELTVTPKVSGLAARIHGVPRLRGSWKAWRALDGWGVEDELRIVDESGNPQSLAKAVRVYDPTARKWNAAIVDAYRQRVTQSTAEWTAGAMVSTTDGVDGDGKAYRARTRIARVTPTSFRYEQDRSYDGGRTWDEARLVIEAKRVAAAAPR